MSIDVDAMAHIMSLLTSLYKDRALAALREISTNARDSNVEAGKADVPIEVTTPNVMTRYLKIKDSGVGLSPDDLQRIYSKYGTSTKRESNDYNGMMGIGKVAPLAYIGSFSLVAIKNGIKTLATISYGENNIPKIDIVDTSSTDEDNGVEVTIECRREDDFKRIAASFFYYWQPGTVLVDGLKPKSIFEEENIEKITDKIYLRKSGGYQDFIVMGNIAYPLAEKPITNQVMEHYRANQHQTIVFVDNGEIDFVPSREEIKLTDKSNKTIQRYVDSYKEIVKQRCEQDIESAATHLEAITAYRKWKSTLTDDLLHNKYKGNDLVFNIKLDKGTPKKNEKGEVTGYPDHEYYYRVQDGDRLESYRDNVTIDPNVLYLNMGSKSAFDAVNVSTYRKRQILKYMADADEPYSRCFIVPRLQAPWTDGVDVIGWDDIAKIKFPRNPYASSRPKEKTKYLIWDTNGKNEVEIEDDDDRKFVWAPKQFREYRLASQISATHQMWCNRNGYVVVYLYEKQVPVFKERFPSTVQYYDLTTPGLKADWNSLDSAVRDVLLSGERTIKALLGIHGKTDDPEIDKFIEPIVNFSKDDNDYYAALAEMYDSGYYYNERGFKYFAKNYPLVSLSLRSCGGSLNQEQIDYINAMYYWRKNK